MRKILLTTLLIILCASCRRFDSNALNHQLIQGTWNQVEIVYSNGGADSLIIEYPQHLTSLRFDIDSCIETMEDMKEEHRFTYKIKNYVLKLDKGEERSNFLNIIKLTKDSLILRSGNQSWKYLRKNL